MSTTNASDALAALEDELRRLPEVSAARVVTDDDGTPVEVHIVASPDKHAKQLVRDVQTVAMARFGIDLDRRVVSIVQLEDQTSLFTGSAPPIEAPANGGVAPRTRLESVTVEPGVGGGRVRATVSYDGATATGEATGPLAPSIVPRLAADATVDALRQLLPAARRLAVEATAVVPLGSRQVATVVVVLATPPYEEVLAGAAVVHSSAPEATAAAVLDATNRRLAGLH